MPTLPFGEYRPDVNNLDGQHTLALMNVLPQGDGYGPIHDLAAFTTALGAQCRGYFYAQDDDGVINIFAGTSNKLYLLDNTYLTWTDVSQGASTYNALLADAHWQFAQFGSYVIATQANDDVQVYQLGVSSAFADLGGSPPDAAYVTVVNRFLVLSGLAANPRRVQWSGLNEIDNWSAGSNSSDFQDFPDGGNVRQVIGGDVGVIQQDNAFRRMLFSPGSEFVFQIDRIAKDVGVLHPYATCGVGDKVFVLSTKGFVMMTPDGTQTPIGAEKVDRSFLTNYDSGAPGLVQCAADPKKFTVIWTFRTNGMSNEYFDAALGYNWLLQRWFPISVTGEYMAPLATPGLTLEGLDALAPGALVISGIADNGSGLARITVSSTAALATGDFKTISGVIGSFTDDVNDTWEITVINGTTFDLVGSAVDSQNVTGTADNGSGKVRLTMASTAAWTTGSKIVVANVGGTTEANGNRTATVVDATHIDLTDVNFVNPWTSGGTVKDRYDSATDGGIVGGSVDEMTTSFDFISTASLPNLSFADTDHKIGFLSGDTLEATLETPETSNDGQRIEVQGFWPITDAGTVYGTISKRENLSAAKTYLNETSMNQYGFVPLIWNTRYAGGRIRIPSGTDWSYASGLRPESRPGGQA